MFVILIWLKWIFHYETEILMMKKIYFLSGLAAVLLMQSVFADHMFPQNGPCETIAKACKEAGYKMNDAHKKFWFDCMRPVVLGKTVKGVAVDAATVKQCRIDKIDELKKELSEFQKAS
jgi:hypothetical protein